MSVQLKIKIKTLAAEAGIIRKEERKVLKKRDTDLYLDLHAHRVHPLRKAARSTLLAYGFLRGQPYRAMESTCRTKPDWKAVETMIRKYGVGDMRDRMQSFSEWKEAS